MEKLNVAVIFGGPSQEHDVSVVSAQQLMDAADIRSMNIIPVYMDFEGRFFHGPSMRQLEDYRPKPKGVHEVMFAWRETGPCLCDPKGNWQLTIDVALPVMHGPTGEDGRVQGLLETIGVPMAGLTALNSALAMRKDATKALVEHEGVKVLPHVLVNHASLERWDELLTRVEQTIGFPAIVKPNNLGSSIGLGLAKQASELLTLVRAALREDTQVLIEPQVQHMQELNIAMVYQEARVRYSAIERPKSSAELLDFKQKYLSAEKDGVSGQAKLGNASVPSQGMLSLTRDINPKLSAELTLRIYDYAGKAFNALGHRGAPRIDFMHNTKTDELWFNEMNPMPGSYGFFLWEAASEPLLFPELINHLVDEALADSVKTFDDLVPQAAQLLPRA